MAEFYLSLGSNIGNRESFLQQAIVKLNSKQGIKILAVSSIYETEPIGYTDQPAFLNMAIGGETTLPPEQLLNTIQDVEKELGRERRIRWGPRTIDIDILTYGSQIIVRGDLEVPHPRMMERAFVLVPLAEIAPGHPIPVHGQQFTTPLELQENVKDKSGVKKWMHSD